MLQYAAWCVWLSVTVWFFSSLVCASTHVFLLFYSYFCHSLFCYGWTAAGLVLLWRVQSRELESNEAFEFFERTLLFLFGGNGF